MWWTEGEKLPPFLIRTIYRLIPDWMMVQKLGCCNKVYLTFDDGPHPENTPLILDILNEQGTRATFFVVGREVKRYPGIVRRMFDEGHTVAGHSWSHRKLSQLAFRDTWAEFKHTQMVIWKAAGVKTTLYRPPYGWVTLPMLAYAAVGRMKLILWSIDSDDDRLHSAEAVLSKGRQVQGGDILLCHDDNNSIIEALPYLLQEWRVRGLEPVSLDNNVQA